MPPFRSVQPRQVRPGAAGSALRSAGRRLRVGLVAAALMGAGAAGPAPAQGQRAEIVRLATQHLPPYQMIVDDQMDGIAVRRVRCALGRMGRPHEIHMMEWAEAQLKTADGEFHGFFVGSANPARARYATPSDAVISEDLVWYIAPGIAVDPNDPADRLRARYSAKFATSKWLHLKRAGYNVVRDPRDAERLLQMLEARHIDVALEYELIFGHAMDRAGTDPDSFRTVPFRAQENMVHFSNAFLAAEPGFLAAFNAALARCPEV